MEELYSTDESDFDNHSVNFSCGNDFCVVKYEDNNIEVSFLFLLNFIG